MHCYFVVCRYVTTPEARHDGVTRIVNMDREDFACAQFFAKTVSYTSSIVTKLGFWASPSVHQPSQVRKERCEDMERLRQHYTREFKSAKERDEALNAMTYPNGQKTTPVCSQL